jgi:uncharacterized membrane protein
VLRTLLHYGAIASLIALIFLCLLWEAVLAPVPSGNPVMMLKALPLLAPLFGILRQRVYTYQWSSLLGLAYFIEGVVRAWSDSGLSQKLAMAEIALSMIFFWSVLLWVRLSRTQSPLPVAR